MVPERLELTAAEMREMGARVIDLLAAYTQNLPSQPALKTGSRDELNRLLWEDIPQQPSDPADVVARVERQILPWIAHCAHPRFFAFVPGPSNFVGAMADTLANGYNVINECWLESSGPTVVELVTLDWIRKLAGMPDTASGLFTSGGSLANLTALVAARDAMLPVSDRPRAVVYFSNQTHSSVAKGLRILGFTPNQFRVLDADDGFRLRPADAVEAIRADKAAGRVPFCIVANAGTTNTGAVDPLEELARLRDRERMWLHVDGAYGAGALFCERGQQALVGLGQADSFSVDPHKWLFQPFDCGCVLVRDRQRLKDAFHAQPEYLRDAHHSDEEPNLWDYGPELTRPFRALKLWMSLQVFGAKAFAEAVERGFQLAEYAEQELRKREGWEIVTPAQMAITTFRFQGSDDLNQQIAARMKADGFALVLSTTLRGRTVLRLCTINPRTTDEDIRHTVARLDEFAKQERTRP